MCVHWLTGDGLRREDGLRASERWRFYCNGSLGRVCALLLCALIFA